MNKTVTINISGIIFHIEEDAYDSLSKYLTTIKGYFSEAEGGGEIMTDIEARIAELLQEKINTSKQVILMVDVENVMSQMGKPEDFGGEQTQRENNNSEKEKNDYAQEKLKRRLFRNPDDKAIGGVCSGLAAYFDIDVVWIRLAMFLLIFFGGLSIWVYIIMWIVIPEAKTTADKLAMRGEAVNINSIAQSLKEEAEDLKNRFDKNKGQYKQQFSDAAGNVKHGMTSVLYFLFNIFGRLIGLLFLLLGGLFLVGYIAALFGISIVDGEMQADHWKEVIFNSSSDYALALIAFIIVFGIPIFMLIYAGVKLLFKIRYSNRWLNMSMGFIWFVGLIMGIVVTVSTLQQFKHDAKLKEHVALQNMSDTITIKLNSAENIINAKNLQSNIYDDEQGVHGNYNFAYSPEGRNILGYGQLEVIETDADSIELFIQKSAKGQNKKEANQNAQDISYSYSQNKNELVFDEIFTVKPGAKFRAQEVNVKLKVPKGKVIYFDKSLKYFLEDADNVTNTWEGDMVNRRWKMTDKGLECLDCENLNQHKEEEKVIINKHRIHVHDENSEVNIDANGIRVKSKNKTEKEEDNDDE